MAGGGDKGVDLLRMRLLLEGLLCRLDRHRLQQRQLVARHQGGQWRRL